MGEGPGGDGRSGRRRAHPGAFEPVAGFEALLGAALRVDHVPDDEAERRAVRAFRAARDAGAHGAARIRRRDDWRPRGRRGVRSLRTALSVLLAGFTLGGVAFAAIGGGADTSAGGAGDPGRTAASSAAGSAQRDSGSGLVAASPSVSEGPDRPDATRGAEAGCRDYERVKGHGGKRETAARKRLAEAAGGEKEVDRYCERTLRKPGPEPRDSRAPGAPDALPTAPATTPSLPPAATAKTPVDPTAAAPDTPVVPDAGGVPDDLGNPGGTGNRPGTGTGAGADAGGDTGTAAGTGTGAEAGTGDVGGGGVAGE